MSCLLRWSVPPSPFIHQTRPGCARCGRTMRVRPPARRWLIVAALFAVTYCISGGPLAAWLIARVGWPEAYAILGGGCGLVSTLGALSVRLPRVAERTVLHRPIVRGPSTGGGASAETLPGLTLREALVDPRQWSLNLAWLLLGGLALILSVHAVPFARDQGVNLAGASLTLTAYGMGSAAGRLAGGAAADWVGALATTRAAYLIQALALVVLLWAPSRELRLASLVAFGVGFAAGDTIIAKAIPDVFGMRAIGAIMGVLTLGWRCGAALGPAAAGFLYDATGSYTIPFRAAPVAVLVSWGLFALGTRRRRR